MNPLKRKRRRILLLFVLGIGVPSLLLGYLAFRGIQNDQALLEKQDREELRASASQVTAEVESAISRAEERFNQHLESLNSSTAIDNIQNLQELKTQIPLVEEFFLFNAKFDIHFPAAKLLYSTDGNQETVRVSSQSSFFRKQIQAGERAEFQEKNFRKAATVYQDSLRQIKNPREKGALLIALARVQRKANLIQEAIDTYSQILENYDQVRSSTGIPLGPAASRELAVLFSTAENPESALKANIDLYRALVGKKWTMEKAEYNFFSSETTQTIEEIISTQESLGDANSYKNDIQTLKDKETAERDKTERLLAFQENALTDLLQVYSQDSGVLPSSIKRTTLEIGGRSYLVSLFGRPGENESQRTDIWGFLIDQDFLKTNVIKNALQHHVRSSKTGWIVRGVNGESLLASETVPSESIEVQTNFASSFPEWRIDLYRQDPRLFESLLISRRGVYFFIFLLIGGILIFGLFLTIRSVSQELELSRMKSDFVSTISHEFKSPLTSIRQLAEMLQSGRVPSEEKRQKYYDVLVEQSERLSLLTENVLSFARMEEGKKDFKFEPIDVASVLEDIVSTVQERVRHDGFELELKKEHPLPSIKADSPALTQAINNLLDNAIKYSGEAKRVTVNAEVKDQHLVITVRDFGLGIKEEELDKVFERFYRGGNELTRTVKGSGLGLTLVKQIVEAHKGSVHVESELEKGSTFSIRLPLDQIKEKKNG